MIKCFLSFSFYLIITSCTFLQAQSIRLLHFDKTVSLRGLSVVNDRIIWVSGTNGRVGISTNGGSKWRWVRVPGHENTDFRDIEAFSGQEAIVLGVTEPAVILRTIDGGNSWITVFEDSSKSLFLDAMDFSGDRGVMIGDPIAGKIFLAETSDRGQTWIKKNPPGMDRMAEGETFFAASGSNIRLTGRHQMAIITGGKNSCLYISTVSGPAARYTLLINQGKESSGANSIAFDPSDRNRAFIVGGDFSMDTSCFQNSLLIRLNPFCQEFPLIPPHGYRSSVEYIGHLKMISCGTTGVDVSSDGGKSWKLISGESFHVCSKAGKGDAVFLAGSQGKIARLKWKEANLK